MKELYFRDSYGEPFAMRKFSDGRIGLRAPQYVEISETTDGSIEAMPTLYVALEALWNAAVELGAEVIE